MTARTARCPRCGRTGVDVVRRRDGVLVLATHSIPDGGGTCFRGSGLPIDEGGQR